MFRGMALLSLALLLSIEAESALAAERMQGGQWELTGSFAGKQGTTTYCPSSQELKAVNGTPADVRADVERTTAAAKCKVQNFKMSGNSVTYTSVCPGSTNDFTTTYHGDSFEVVMNPRTGDAKPSQRSKAWPLPIETSGILQPNFTTKRRNTSS